MLFLPSRICFFLQEVESGSKHVRTKWLFPRLSQNLDENLWSQERKQKSQQNHLFGTWQFRAKSTFRKCADCFQVSAFFSFGIAQDSKCSRTRFWSCADKVWKGNSDNFRKLRNAKRKSWRSLSSLYFYPFLFAPLSQAVDKQHFVGKLGIVA